MAKKDNKYKSYRNLYICSGSFAVCLAGAQLVIMKDNMNVAAETFLLMQGILAGTQFTNAINYHKEYKKTK